MLWQRFRCYVRGPLRFTRADTIKWMPRQRVRLTIDERPTRLSCNSSEPIEERHDELRWLANDSRPYAGEWVALDGPRLVAHGLKLATVSAAASAAGVTKPFFARVPREKDVPFGGW